MTGRLLRVIIDEGVGTLGALTLSPGVRNYPDTLIPRPLNHRNTTSNYHVFKQLPIMRLPQKRPHTPPDPAVSIDRTIGTRAPGQEYSTPHRTALKTVVWWESLKSPLQRVPKTEIFKKLDFKHSQAYLVLQDELPGTESSRTFPNHPLRDTAIRRGPHLKIPEEKID